MVLFTHIIFAIVSMVCATYTAIFPSTTKLRITYFLTFVAIASGTVMVFANPQGLGRMCLTGIFYLGLITTMSMLARKKLKKFQMVIY